MPNSSNSSNKTTQASKSIEGQEQWFVKIDGAIFGPSSRADLEGFLRPPRLCSFLEVMCSKEPGAWHSISKKETLDDVLRRFRIDPISVQAPRQHSLIQSGLLFQSSLTSRLRDAITNRFSELAQFFWKLRVAWGTVLIILVVSAFFLVEFSDPAEDDRKLIAEVTHIWRDVNQFVSKERPVAEWSEFASSSRRQLEPILHQLERRANVRHPAQQQLLFGGRENLLEILKAGEPPSKQDLSVKQFEHRLQLANESVGQ